MSDLERLRERGGTRVTVGGQDYDIRVLMLRHDPQDVTTEEPVLRLDDVELLVSAVVREAIEDAGRDVASAYRTGLADGHRNEAIEALREFARFLYQKADNAETTVDKDFAQGMRNAAVDAELFLPVIRDWMNGTDTLRCGGCGLPYGDPGWCDVVIPTKYWIQISPREDGGGVLCLTCMARALEEKGLGDVPVKITSGPWKFYPGGGGHSRTNATAMLEGVIEELKKLPQHKVGDDDEIYVPFKLVWILLNQRGGEWQ